MIYLDTSVALAWLLTADRQPPASFWDGTLVSSRLLEYEILTPLHAHVGGLARRGGSPACRAGRAAGADPAGSGAGAGCLSRSGAAADPRRPASGVVRVSGGSRSGSGTRELRPANECGRPRDGHSASRSGGIAKIVTRNLRDFPADHLAPHGLTAQHPDAFIAGTGRARHASAGRGARDPAQIRICCTWAEMPPSRTHSCPVA